MEKNLNVAPTEQELINAGFKTLIDTRNDSRYMVIKLSGIESGWSHRIKTNFKTCHLWLGRRRTKIDFTKQKINDVFALFNQPLPQWEKPKPKVGEVWQDENFIFWVNELTDTFLSGGIIYGENRKGHSITFYELDNLTKLADTLDDYYKEKFLKNCTDWANKNETDKKSEIDGFKVITMDMLTEEEKPHQYSYEGLNAEGKIPHDRSGEDQDSIEAFKKLLAICEALNGIFERTKYYIPTDFLPYFCEAREELLCAESTTYCDTPIYFTSKKAFDAFKSAPENVELFKTFLKIK